MKIIKFSAADTHKIPLGEVFGLGVCKLIEESDSDVLVAFSDEISFPKMLTDFFRGNPYCVDTTLFGVCEQSGFEIHSAHNEEINDSAVHVILINLNTSHTAEEIYAAAAKALDHRRKDILAISLTGEESFEVAAGSEIEKMLRVKTLISFCDSIGEIIAADLLARLP